MRKLRFNFVIKSQIEVGFLDDKKGGKGVRINGGWNLLKNISNGRSK